VAHSSTTQPAIHKEKVNVRLSALGTAAWWAERGAYIRLELPGARSRQHPAETCARGSAHQPADLLGCFSQLRSPIYHRLGPLASCRPAAAKAVPTPCPRSPRFKGLVEVARRALLAGVSRSCSLTSSKLHLYRCIAVAGVEKGQALTGRPAPQSGKGQRRCVNRPAPCGPWPGNKATAPHRAPSCLGPRQ
jgi:hypothetical protein